MKKQLIERIMKIDSIPFTEEELMKKTEEQLKIIIWFYCGGEHG